MKKASILSFQFADNYGALLQIYALSKKLSSYNLEVEVIDFSPKELLRPYSIGPDFRYTLKKFGFLRTLMIVYVKFISRRKNLIKQKNFQDFRDKQLNITQKKYDNTVSLMNDSELKKYDYYFVGSDQVWNPAFFQYAVEAYFLKFANSKGKKISYAASIAESLDEKSKGIFSENLKNFDAVSVREKSAKKEISNLTDKEVKVTLDPTLLLTKKDWQQIMGQKGTDEDYILVYDLVRDKRIIELSNLMAENLNAKIVCYSDIKYYENTLRTFNGDNPVDFLRLVNDAKFVITSSFHGTAFSLLFEKQFFTVPHPTRGSRMIDLLQSLDLGNRLYNSGGNGFIGNAKKIDYEEINSKLELLRNKSEKFLDSAIGN